MSNVVALGSRGQQHATPRSNDCLPRRTDALDRKRQFVERRCRFAGGILDRQSRDAGRHTSGNAVCHVGRCHPVSRREVRIDGQVDRGSDLGDVRQASIAGGARSYAPHAAVAGQRGVARRDGAIRQAALSEQPVLDIMAILSATSLVESVGQTRD